MTLLGDAAGAFALLFEPARLAWLLLGILIGMTTGLLPGLGGIVGMTLMFPFIYGMDPYAGVALLIGIQAVNTMSDSFPAVLLGIPGSAGAAATIVDGYPMAQRGEGNRALGAIFFVSAVGGIIGGLCLFIMIPIAKPLVLALHAPELLMLIILGLSMVGVLSRGAPVKGIAAAVLGILLSCVGTAAVSLEYRYTFDSLYLYEGLSIPVIVMGLFAIPELIDLLITKSQGRAAAHPTGEVSATRQLLQGIKDAIRHKVLVIRSSIFGALLGVIPGLGGAVVDWILYGTTVQSSKDKSQFGKGDIRGVIAPESATNSREGGALIPTLFFGIPGSGSMAVLLAGLLLLGIEAGPRLLQSPDGNTIILVVIWTLILANVVSAIMCLLMSKHMVRISELPSRVLVPPLVVLILLGAYQSNRSVWDMVVVLAIGVVGWALKQFNWSRPALLIGFVLGEPAERNLSISMARYGFDWLLRPGVIVIGIALIVSIVVAVRMKGVNYDSRSLPPSQNLTTK